MRAKGTPDETQPSTTVEPAEENSIEPAEENTAEVVPTEGVSIALLNASSETRGVRRGRRNEWTHR
jgi:hypothetical protein